MNKLILLCFLAFGILGFSQTENKFANEVKNIKSKNDTLWNSKKPTIVFTGSSSVRMWKDVQERFPNHQILNTGFGGSQTSDLLEFQNELITHYKPIKVFIYEGDNDIAADKSSKEIISTFNTLIGQLKTNLPNLKIVLIAAKPSIARWNLKRNYKKLNRKLKKLSKKDNNIEFADVWRPMLTKNKLKKDLFIEDGLHMNKKGYDIWHNVIKNYIN